MSDLTLDTRQLHDCVDRMRAGDLTARDDLLRSASARLERLARKMLGRFPQVHRWVDTGDVLQNALVRLLRSLEEVRPDSVRDFFGLAAEHMRRELLDLTRHFLGPQGLGAHHASGVLDASRTPETADADADLERWSSFHEEAARLPPDEREVLGLIFYHGWTHEQVAELLGISPRTVQRRWTDALAKLQQAFAQRDQ